MEVVIVSPKQKSKARGRTGLQRQVWAAEQQRQRDRGQVAWHVRRARRRRIAIVLWALAPIIVVSHLLEHWKVFSLMSPGWQDLLIGYPTAAILLVVGGILWGV